MSYSFTAYGHPNVRATHKTTLEFTKDKELTPKGDCIVGVKAGFDLSRIKQFIASLTEKKIQILIEVDGFSEKLEGIINPDFGDGKELVLRKTNFLSKRTLCTNASKSACDLKKNMVKKLQDSGKEIKISLHGALSQSLI